MWSRKGFGYSSKHCQGLSSGPEGKLCSRNFIQIPDLSLCKYRMVSFILLIQGGSWLLISFNCGWVLSGLVLADTDQNHARHCANSSTVFWTKGQCWRMCLAPTQLTGIAAPRLPTKQQKEQFLASNWVLLELLSHGMKLMYRLQFFS